MQLRFAHEDDHRQLGLLRRRIFRDELGIQEEGYQDVFHDAYSKNVVLERNGSIIGAVRLAFSRESQDFFVSYLFVVKEWRCHATLRLLLGAVASLMKANGITQVIAHSADANVRMYLSLGCRIVGPRFRKYGFTCEWTPMLYRFGAKGESESRARERSEPLLRVTGDPAWRFAPTFLPCPDLASYRTAAEALWSGDPVNSLVLPYFGQLGSAERLFRNPCLTQPRLVDSTADYPRSSGQSYHEDSGFNQENAIIVLRQSTVRDIAALYSWLTRRRLVTLGDWTELASSLHSSAKTVFIFAGADDKEDAISAALRVQAFCQIGIVFGRPEIVSTQAIKNFLEFVGPWTSEERIHVAKSCRMPEVPNEVGCTHTVWFGGGAESRGAIDTFREHLSSGFQVGVAARLAAVGVSKPGDAQYLLIGDPCLQITSHIGKGGYERVGSSPERSLLAG
jgi:Acetyltransferase (GNAT) domain